MQEPKLPVFRGEESSKSDDASDDADSSEGGDDGDNDRRLLTVDAQGASNSTKTQVGVTITD